MITGILFGIAAAMLNSIGYLTGSRFLLVYKSPLRLLVSAHFCMMLFSIPLMLALFPFRTLIDPTGFWITAVKWLFLFAAGQASFFTALRYFEASRLASLLGLKIIVLAVIFITIRHVSLSLWQWVAVFLAAAAGVMINWSGSSGKKQITGWLFVLTTLVCYSLGDIKESEMVRYIMDSGCSNLRSGLAATSMAYTLIGIAMLPGMFFLRLTKKQAILAAPYAGLWLTSQVFLFIAFGLLLPVFANVILATRGIFSVIIGCLLPLLGLAKFDSHLTWRKWVLRGCAAMLMLTAIMLYSFASAGMI